VGKKNPPFISLVHITTHRNEGAHNIFQPLIILHSFIQRAQQQKKRLEIIEHKCFSEHEKFLHRKAQYQQAIIRTLNPKVTRLYLAIGRRNQRPTFIPPTTTTKTRKPHSY